MTSEAPRRLLLIADSAEGAFIDDLRSLGHIVLVAGDIGEARRLMATEGAELALLPARAIAGLADLESWRRSARTAGTEVRQLMGILERKLNDLGAGEGAASRTATRAEIAVVVELLGELLDDLETGSGQDVTRTTFRLEDAVEAAALAVYPAASDRNQRLAVTIDDDATTLRADERKLRRALGKLLDHASRKARRSGSITLHAGREANDCLITLTYDAATPGSMTRPAAGEAADGLAVVSRLVEVQGGRLRAEKDGSVETVHIRLPNSTSPTPAVELAGRVDGKF